MKPIAFLTFEEWIADMIKAMAPYAKTIKPIGVYFATAFADDVNVDFNRKIADYGNHHFTSTSLADFYGAETCAFNKVYGIVLTFDSYQKVVSEGGFYKPKKRGGERRGGKCKKKICYPLASRHGIWYTIANFCGTKVSQSNNRQQTTERKQTMKKIGNWIVSADIGGLTYAWKFFDCTAQEAVFCLRRKYSNAENVKVESALGKFDRAIA